MLLGLMMKRYFPQSQITTFIAFSPAAKPSYNTEMSTKVGFCYVITVGVIISKATFLSTGDTLKSENESLQACGWGKMVGSCFKQDKRLA